MTTYDVIVLGTGGVGSASAFHLAHRGLRVLGLDRFPGGHDQGSSHGHTRMIRKAYFEHPDYVPLLHRAYELWHELEGLCGQQLYHEIGLLEIGPPTGSVVPGVLESARQHRLPVEPMTRADVANRFPGFQLPEGYHAVFEREAGYLFVEPCVLAHLAQAARQGAACRHGETVLEWQVRGDTVEVRTTADVYAAASLVITAGAWSQELLAGLGIRLVVRRKHMHWFDSDVVCFDVDRGCPAFYFETDDGGYYGLPNIDGEGLKVAEHTGGAQIPDPLADDKSVDLADLQRVQRFLSQHFPQAKLQPRRHAVCYYTMSPDDHFIVDRHPHHPQVAFAAGLSGHGFKFTTVLGAALADLIVDQRTELPIAFLNARRDSLFCG